MITDAKECILILISNHHGQNDNQRINGLLKVPSPSAATTEGVFPRVSVIMSFALVSAVK
jgi:hypothetical protein